MSRSVAHSLVTTLMSLQPLWLAGSGTSVATTPSSIRRREPAR